MKRIRRMFSRHNLADDGLSPAEKVPVEIVAMIFDNLSTKQRIQLESVCRKWRQAGRLLYDGQNEFNDTDVEESDSFFHRSGGAGIFCVNQNCSCAASDPTRAWPFIHEKLIQYAHYRCQEVTSITIGNYRQIHQKSLVAIAQMCSHLETLKLSHVALINIGSPFNYNIFKSFNNLRVLGIEFVRVFERSEDGRTQREQTDEATKIPAKLQKSLEVLCFRLYVWCKITASFVLRMLAQHSQLKRLALEIPIGSQMARFTETSLGRKMFASIPIVEILTLNLSTVGERWKPPANFFHSISSQCKFVETLWIFRADIDQDSMNAIVHNYTKMKCLGLQDCHVTTKVIRLLNDKNNGTNSEGVPLLLVTDKPDIAEAENSDNFELVTIGTGNYKSCKERFWGNITSDNSGQNVCR